MSVKFAGKREQNIFTVADFDDYANETLPGYMPDKKKESKQAIYTVE